ncbi:MAG: ATP-binding cassette domain-containing protein [Ectothiorhodospiraceae bacterium]|nr:ATP-binding cassette domain-containing protein [Ectothiorhodospiraceae bacterium]
MIEIRDLTKRFGPVVAVDGVSFEVERGEVLGFLGPNGAGKSTTMKMVTGFLAPDAGSVTVGGDDIASSPIAVKRRIGYLPEGAPLYGDMTPRAFLGFIAEIRGLAGARRRERIDTVVEQVSIGPVLDRPIETLSKGFKRRVGLAQAILHDPEVLVLDEPTDGLDPNQKHEVRNLIRGMSSDKVIVLSTHILEEVEAVCSRAIIIASGRLVSDGTPEALVSRAPNHNVVCCGLRGVEASGAVEALGAVDGVQRIDVVAASAERVSLQIHPVNGASLLAPVAEFARTRGWEVDELYAERGRLDDVFRAITRPHGSSAGNAGAASGEG